MMAEIFSSFDDHNSVFMSMYILMWLCSLLVLMTFNMSIWANTNRFTYLLNVPKNVISSQVTRSFGLKLGGFTNLMAALFSSLLILNLLGLVPYVFSNTSHLAMTLSLSIPLWMSLIISSAILNPSSTAAGLLPAGAPALLNPFLVLVETVSILVRPVTLSIRLAANMSAGHIVLGLISTYLCSAIFIYPKVTLLTLLTVQTLYFMFEIGVSLIQAYIFSLLITLYSDDHAK
uniref:ATP synthase subunit a n=1 Tax=Haliotis tuberculata tuberculata TaxID=454124 RepID=D2DMM1_HALTU|nr:ATP synthase F0 subunit 6 [Haliotis tuberculata tuberculata]ACL81488.1 ATP synthase F0 subunit 6 [Haliotis tuberculata tuberculata]